MAATNKYIIVGDVVRPHGIRGELCIDSHGSNRNLADIEAIIQGSGLDAAVKNTSLNIFRKVALAEARVHGKTLDEVHFHGESLAAVYSQQ